MVGYIPITVRSLLIAALVAACILAFLLTWLIVGRWRRRGRLRRRAKDLFAEVAPQRPDLQSMPTGDQVPARTPSARRSWWLWGRVPRPVLPCAGAAVVIGLLLSAAVLDRDGLQDTQTPASPPAPTSTPPRSSSPPTVAARSVVDAGVQTTSQVRHPTLTPETLRTTARFPSRQPTHAAAPSPPRAPKAPHGAEPVPATHVVAPPSPAAPLPSLAAPVPVQPQLPVVDEQQHDEHHDHHADHPQPELPRHANPQAAPPPCILTVPLVGLRLLCQ